MLETNYTLQPIGYVESTLTSRNDAPSQGDEGAPNAWLTIDLAIAEGLDGLAVGDEILVITWFHQSKRDVLKLHPRWDPNNPLAGVFAMRSPDRPNPLGLHRVTILEIADNQLHVGPLEAIDGTPIVDIKPVLNQTES